MKKLLIIFFVITMLTTACRNISYTEEINSPSKTTVNTSTLITNTPSPVPTPFEPADLNILIFKLDDDVQRLYIDYKYLESSDYMSGSVEEMLAISIRENMDESIDWIKEAAREYPATDDNYVYYGLSNIITTKQNDSRFLSVLTDNHLYTGGAHGNVERYTYVYERNISKLCSLEDLLSPGITISDVEAEINRQMKSNIDENGHIYYSDSISFDSLYYPPCYYIENDLLIICFQTYEIAPYAAGIQEFTMPADFLIPPSLG